MELLRRTLIGALLLTPAIADAATASSIVSISASVAVTCVLASKVPIDPRLATIVLYRLKAAVDGAVQTVSVGCNRTMPRILIRLERVDAGTACLVNRIPAAPAGAHGKSSQEYLAVLNF